ncbi:MAG: amidohydrolase [Chloroflexota bacterium]|nr:amidohydrolase [Chloroflexota bacterium]
MPSSANLLLVNARVLTMDRRMPHAAAVAVSGHHIVAVGSDSEILSHQAPWSEVIDCLGLPLLPGINDAHCHVLATASSLSSVDCGPACITSLDQLLSAIASRAEVTPSGQWVRGSGLDPGSLAERRLPTRWELDSVASGNPVRINHSSGHALALNSLGLALAGIEKATPDPVDGVIDRDPETGEPTGVLFEAATFLRERLGPTRSQEEFISGVSRLSKRLLACGITSVQDAGPENGIQQWQIFKSLVEDEVFRPRVVMMAGVRNLDQFAGSNLGWGSGNRSLSLGHAKIMLTLTTGSLQPAPEDLAQLGSSARKLGFPVAIHAIEQEAIEAIVSLPELLKPLPAYPARDGTVAPRSVPRSRIEHCAECPPPVMDMVARSGATVVTQPGFIYWRGDSYRQRVAPHLIPHLFDCGALVARGVPLAFGSDSPVIDPSPWPGIYSAITSRTLTGGHYPRPGFPCAPNGQKGPGISLQNAVEAHTLGAARAEGSASTKGVIRPDMLADLILLDTGLEEESLHRLPRAQSLVTIVGGKILWRQGSV